MVARHPRKPKKERHKNTSTMNNGGTSPSPPRGARCRVILLLDLDCFYAQCERVRLGLDANDCALALLQVNNKRCPTHNRSDEFAVVFIALQCVF